MTANKATKRGRGRPKVHRRNWVKTTGDGKKIMDRINMMLRYFTSEFGEELSMNKLLPKITYCGNPRCNSCPHGPYWYRAVFNPKTRKWVFKYLGKSLHTGMLLSAKEKQIWDRLKFFDDEMSKLRREKSELCKKLIK